MKIFDLSERMARFSVLEIFAPLALLALLGNANLAWAEPQNNDAGSPRGMSLAAPEKAILSPNGGRLEFSRELDIETLNGKSFISFAVPESASNLQVSVVGRTVERFSTEPAALEIGTNLADLRQNLLKRKSDLEAALLAVNTRIALYQGIPEKTGVQEMEQLQQTLANAMPQLGRQKDELETQLEIVNQELKAVPANAKVGRRVIVALHDDKAASEKVRVNYSYMLPNCGWRALYEFNARPDEGSADVIDVKLLAEIWQYSGSDWKDTTITIATRGQGSREPAPLPEWVIDSSPRPEPRAAMTMNAVAAKASRHVEGAREETDHAPVIADTQSVYASWTLVTKTLPEGKSRLVISSDAWNAPLEWLARPGRHESQVFLMAKYNLPQTQAWPDGMAVYCVNGQSIGSGPFSPKGGEAIIYLGADPRVNVITTVDNRKHGERGLINTSKTWTWAWTYTISNEHDKAIKVRLERPMPIIVDQGVTVSYENRPEAQKDEKEHYFYWIVDVPAHGKATVEHGITINSPSKLPLLPDVP